MASTVRLIRRTPSRGPQGARKKKYGAISAAAAAIVSHGEAGA